MKVNESGVLRDTCSAYKVWGATKDRTVALLGEHVVGWLASVGKSAI